MTTTLRVTGGLLVVLPVLYNLLFARLAARFDYPDILRRPSGEVLERFAAGGDALVLTWWGFALSALLLAPAVVLVSRCLGDADPTLLALTTTVGVLASAVQVLGLIRWPFAVPHLARLATDPAAAPETRAAVEVVFQTLNRYLGVAVGEHLGYLLTGVWSALVGVAILQSDLLHPAFGWAGILVAPAFAVGAIEFVGRFEPDGWPLAGTVVPVAYGAWSVWLLAVGVGLVVAA